MATSRDTLFNKLSGSFWNAGVTFERTNPVPLEKYSVFQTKQEADNYALTNVVAYPGQPVAVVDETSTKLYFINNNGTLVEIGSAASTGDINADLIALSSKYETFLTTQYAPLSGRVDSLDTIVNTLSGADTVEGSVKHQIKSTKETLESSLSIDIVTQATPEDGMAATYVLSQGGTDKTVKINIPKDKVVSSADVVKFDTDEAASAGTDDKVTKAGTYIKIIFENKDTIYVDVPELANIYQGTDSDTIDITVSNNTTTGAYEISAIVKTGSIGAEHLTTELSNRIQTVIDREAADRTVIETLSGEATVEGSVKWAAAQATSGIADLSTALSNNLSTEIERAKAAEKSLSDLISAEVERATQAEHDLSTDYIQKIGDISTSLSTTVDAKILAQYNDLTGKINTEATTRDTAVKSLSTSLSTTVDAKILAQYNDLTGKINTEKTRAEAAEAILSGAIDKRVAVDGTYLTGEQTLNVKHISQEDYHTLVSNGTADTNTVYVVSSDALNLFNEKIINLAKGTEYTDAATYGQLSDAVADLQGQITTAVNGGVDTLSTKVFGADGLSVTLKTAIDNEVTARTQAVSNEATARETAITNLSTELKGDVSTEKTRAEAAEAGIAATLNTVSSDYVKDTVLTTWKNTTGLSAAGEGKDNQVVLWKDVKDITTAMHFRDAITSSAEKTAAAALAEITNPKKGDVVIDTATSKEYVYTGSEWRELGDEGIYCTKTEFESFKNDTFTPFKSAVELSVAGLNGSLAAEVAARTAADEALSGDYVAKIATAKAEAIDETKISAMYLNGVAFTMADHTASLSVDIIDCGGAN